MSIRLRVEDVWIVEKRSAIIVSPPQPDKFSLRGLGALLRHNVLSILAREVDYVSILIF
jgi:hypothetical protein